MTTLDAPPHVLAPVDVPWRPETRLAAQRATIAAYWAARHSGRTEEAMRLADDIARGDERLDAALSRGERPPADWPAAHQAAGLRAIGAWASGYLDGEWVDLPGFAESLADRLRDVGFTAGAKL